MKFCSESGRFKQRFVFAAMVLGLTGFAGTAGTGCNQLDFQGTDIGYYPPGTVPPVDTTHVYGSGATPQIGNGCSSPGSSQICLGLKYAVYKDPSTGTAIVSQNDALSNLSVINQLWSQCQIRFQIDSYDVVTASNYGMNYQPSSMDELDLTRKNLQDSQSFLVATTGTWAGTLGSQPANAWTAMPGGPGPFGTILERPVATYPNLIAHELGHYMNLPHVNDTSDVMNPTIYGSSTKLTSDQCQEARSAAVYYWPSVLR